MFRQGDVLIQQVSGIPSGVRQRANLVLAEGASTGHRHEVAPGEGITLFERNGTLFLRVSAARALVVHPEHGTITLKSGIYRVWRQREYTGQAEQRFVMD